MCRSYHKRRPIRVFRSSALGGRYAPPYLDEEEDDDVAYRYDGLYMVRAVWDVRGNETELFPCTGEEGWQTYFFTRLPKKPLDGKYEPEIEEYNQLGLQELWGSIQKMRGVRKPKKFEIPLAPMKLPPLKKGAITGENKDRKVISFTPEKAKAPSPDEMPRAKRVVDESDSDSSDEEASKQKCVDSGFPSSTSQPKRPSPIAAKALPKKVVTPRPRLNSVSHHKKSPSSISNQRKRPAPDESSDTSESESSTVSSKRKSAASPRLSSQLSCDVLPAFLPKRATAAKAEAANRDMFGKKPKRPYKRKETAASPLRKKRAKRKSVDDDSSSASEDVVDQSVLTVGSRVLVAYKGSNFKATIRRRREKNNKHDFLIHYDGNKKSNVHWVPLDRLQEILSIAIDVSPEKKPAKGKRGGWNKKTREKDSTSQNSDVSDDEESNDEGKFNEITEAPSAESQPNVNDEESSDFKAVTKPLRDNKPKSGPAVKNNKKTDVDDSEQPSADDETSASSTKKAKDGKKPRATVVSEVCVAKASNNRNTGSLSSSNYHKASTLSSIDEDTHSYEDSDGDDSKAQEVDNPTSEFKFPIGCHIYVEYRQILYTSTVLKARKKRTASEYLVHYEGYKKASNRWVKESSLHFVNSETTKRFDEQRLIPSELLHESDPSGFSDFSMSTRGKRAPDAQNHHISRKKPPRRTKSETSASEVSLLYDIEPGVAFLPGSVVFAEWSGALYLAKMVKKRFSGDRMEYLVSYDGFNANHDAWVSINNIYEVNPQTKRVFKRINADIIKSSENAKKPDPPVQRNVVQSDDDSGSEESPPKTKRAPKKSGRKKPDVEEVITYSDPPLPRRREARKKHDDDSATPSEQAATTRSQVSQLDMQGIPSGVEFLPGSTLFAERKGGLHLAKMVKKRGKGDYMEYFVSFNGLKESESTWISTALVYEINPQTKRMFRQLSK